MSQSEQKNILLLMSGSIACYKASQLISDWVKQGHRVKVACSKGALEFIGAATLEGLSGEPVFSDTYQSGRAMEHINLTRWADWIVACPATANLINKLAAGIADDAITTLWLAAFGQRKPMFVVPAMNSHMLDYPATRSSIKQLTSWGIHVLPTAEGDLACGEQGAGRLLEPDWIRQRIETLSGAAKTASPTRILITAGGTREPIDSVRFIGNISSGRTGAALGDSLLSRGHEVIYLAAQDAATPVNSCEQHQFTSFSDLQEALQRLLSGRHFDDVIHAAAVSDFSVSRIKPESINGEPHTADKLSSGGNLVIELTPNPKLLPQLKTYSVNKKIRVIGFKLTSNADPALRKTAVNRLLADDTVDFVVHNDLSEIGSGRHPFNVYPGDGEVYSCTGPQELADQLLGLLEQ